MPYRADCASCSFLLHSLQLNYVRHVLPNHAVQSALPGTGPHNLIAFDTSSPTLNSPYVVLSGLSDESKWPELSSGRSSPPLAPTFGREESNKAATSGRRRGATPAGATGLNYSQTIVGKGRGIGGAGMRVGGRQRSWKGRGGALEVAESDEAGTGEAEAQEVTTENLKCVVLGVPCVWLSADPPSYSRRNSLETSIHRKRLQDNALTLQPPPPVVIHSPVRTPQDSPVSTVDPSRANTPPTPSPEAQQRPIAVPVDLTVAAALLEDADAAERAADLQAYDAASITTPIQDDTTGSSPDVDSSLPLSHITEGSDLSTSAPLVLMHSHPSTSTSPIHSSSLQSSPSISSVPDAAETSSSLGGRYASVASSGVSLFGVSRLNGTSEGVMGRERSDSDSSSFAAGSTSNRIDAIEEDDEDNLQPPPPPPVFQPPRNFRVRERRRVNISGRMLVPISEPANEEDGPHVTISAIPHPSSAPADGPARQLSDPSLPTLAEGKPSGAPGPVLREGSPTERKRKISAPNVLLTAEPTVVESSPAVSPSTSPKPRPRPPPAPPSRHHSGIVFTKRADMPLVTPPPAPKRSALTALLTAKSESPSASNPFSQLYAALVSRASDALKLTLYFPQSKTPSKKLSVRVKKDLTVEEVIGAGLWQYWEEGREPKLDLGEEEEHDETTKWNLRIVEDDGEVDEDFPGSSSRAAFALHYSLTPLIDSTGPHEGHLGLLLRRVCNRPRHWLAA